VADYLQCFDALFDHVDYFVVNVSSPNTPGLRELQEKEPLTTLLRTLKAAGAARAAGTARATDNLLANGTAQVNDNAQHDLAAAMREKPILLKIAPDLTGQQLDDIIEIVQETGTDG